MLEPGSSAGLLVYENVWAGPFAAALRRGGGQLVASGRIPVQALLAALDAVEAADPQSEHEKRGTRHARTDPRGRQDRRHRRNRDRGLQPGLPSTGRPLGRAGAAAGASAAARRSRSRRRRRRPPPAADMDAKLAQLKELGELREAGVLTDLEFEQQKNRILNS